MVTLRQFNNFLSVAVIVVIGYLLLSPVYGNVSFWINKRRHPEGSFIYSSHLATITHVPPKNLKPIPNDNRIVIPSMQLDQEIHEGTSVYTLNKGLWHQPGTGNPVSGGNMVVLGHRFTYKGPAVLFNLDKVNLGDKFSVFWEHKEYIYQVKDIKIVDPLDLTVVQNTDQPRLTMYTCTPLWTSRQRLVIISEPWNEASP